MTVMLPLHSSLELKIEELGAMGDGMAQHQSLRIFVPYSCVGDVVRVTLTDVTNGHYTAKIDEVLEPSIQRQTPACEHFAKCGGCLLQQLDDASYIAFKRSVLAKNLLRLGVDTAVLGDVVQVGAASRRRIELKVSVFKGEVSLGFLAAKSHQLIDISACPVAMPTITKLIEPLKECLRSFKKASHVQAVSLTALADGVDVMLTLSKALKAGDKDKLLAFAEAESLLRVSVKMGGSVYSRSNADVERVFGGPDVAMVQFADVEVNLPPQSFLQATEQGQHAITSTVLSHVGEGAGRVVDLFSGAGTYSFPLARQVQRLVAYEGNEDMTNATHNALMTAGLENCMAVHQRDLFKSPLTADECSSFDVIVMNPPRAGAKEQSYEIAKSTVKKLVMVSCSPTSFERDARILLAAGFVITHLLPIDQFYWSGHLELVALFERKA